VAAIVRTVLGDIPPDALGPTDAHDHAFFASPLAPGQELDDLDRAVSEVGALAAAGARAFVDWTPIGLGRDLEALRAVSIATGMHIVAATGVHRDAHYAAGDGLRAATVDELARRFTADVLDEEIGSGVVKVGAGYHRFTPFEAGAFEAAALAHARTGVAVCVHTERGTMGLPIIERLTAAGVAAESIILAHVDRNPDAVEHAELASTGAYLEYDGAGRTKYWPDSTLIALIGALADGGFADRLLCGGDLAGRAMSRAYGGGPGMEYVFARFKPRVERELGAELARRIFVDNPSRAFAFEPVQAIENPA
jgi:predicted metal-dependent phosphotriesterase family hydrolase